MCTSRPCLSSGHTCRCIGKCICIRRPLPRPNPSPQPQPLPWPVVEGFLLTIYLLLVTSCLPYVCSSSRMTSFGRQDSLQAICHEDQLSALSQLLPPSRLLRPQMASQSAAEKRPQWQEPAKPLLRRQLTTTNCACRKVLECIRVADDSQRYSSQVVSALIAPGGLPRS